MKLRDLTLKPDVQTKYKQYRNLLSTLIKESKRSYLQNISKATLMTWKVHKETNIFKELFNIPPSYSFGNSQRDSQCFQKIIW